MSEVCKFAEEMNTSTLKIIGKGSCGTVWGTVFEKDHVFKREDGVSDRSLRNDFEMHRRILRSSRKLSSLQIQIPACDHFIPAENLTWWRENHQKFPPDYRAPCNLIQSQRIPPFSEATRQLLIQSFCPRGLVSEISASVSNKDCLIRPYLGRRRTPRPHNSSRFAPFSLRNFPLHVDQMELLEISTNDMNRYTMIMAEALAMMHWVAEVDGNDIEFVLAPPGSNSPEESTTRPSGAGLKIKSEALETHSVWILDFDLCRQMEMNSKGVEQAVTAFWRNDPFYPRPGKDLLRDRSLWAVFREHYIQRSEAYIDAAVVGLEEAEKRRGLSKQFIEMIEQDGSARKANKIFAPPA